MKVNDFFSKAGAKSNLSKQVSMSRYIIHLLKYLCNCCVLENALRANQSHMRECTLWLQPLSEEELRWLNSEPLPAYPDGSVPKRVRKEVRTLTSDEWATYVRVSSTLYVSQIENE